MDDSEGQAVDFDNVHDSKDDTSGVGTWSRRGNVEKGEEESSQGTNRRRKTREISAVISKHLQFNCCTVCH